MQEEMNQRDLLTRCRNLLFSAIAFYEGAAQQLSLWINQILIFSYLGERLANSEESVEESGWNYAQNKGEFSLISLVTVNAVSTQANDAEFLCLL